MSFICWVYLFICFDILRSTFHENLLEILPTQLLPLLPEPMQGYFRYECTEAGQQFLLF